MLETNPTLPVLTCVLVSAGGLANILRALESLRTQTIAHQMEVILLMIHPAVETALYEAAFARFRQIQVAKVTSRGAIAAEGIRAASAPLIALVENHAFLESNWSEVLVQAMGSGLSGACGRFTIANPATCYSRSYALNFKAPFMRKAAPSPDGVEIVDGLPWHNVVYRKSVLLALDQPLESLMDPESSLQAAIRKSGGRFGYTDLTSSDHLNCSTLPLLLRSTLELGRSEAVLRSRNWSLKRRCLYAAASPLFPWIRLWHLRSRLLIYREFGSFAAMASLLLLQQLAASVGEALGFATGPEKTNWVQRHEMHLEFRLCRRELLLFSEREL